MRALVAASDVVVDASGALLIAVAVRANADARSVSELKGAAIVKLTTTNVTMRENRDLRDIPIPPAIAR